jgi:signal peptidase I
MRYLLLLLFLTGCTTSDHRYFIFDLPDTGSMEPAFSGGDLMFLDTKFPYEDLKIGDVVAYSDERYNMGRGIIHRIVGKAPNNQWIMKGDNNPTKDRYLLRKDTYDGKLTRVDFK